MKCKSIKVTTRCFRILKVLVSKVYKGISHKRASNKYIAKNKGIKARLRCNTVNLSVVGL
ncbi:hypothetical protein C6Y39_08790 [Alteromonas gracilis]|uniref:Uncharacterized protein n=1 Tax=Alteromonas gracilis TaxID=1479524 RepID=A0ABX5CM91_9ALTE|nr:hypothetical protein C6Y39_08790 [Alteromonas gracilis]